MSARRIESLEREFVDTNVLVYAHDASAGKKQAIAQGSDPPVMGQRDRVSQRPGIAGIFCK